MLEIGVGSGVTLDHILKSIPRIQYHGVDPFTEYRNDINGTDKRIKENKSSLFDVLQKWKAKKANVVIFNARSEILAPNLKKDSFDLIFIDGEHTEEQVRLDSTLYWHTLSTGGVMVWHDYDRHKMFPGVKKAVDEFVEDNELELLEIGDLTYVIKPLVR
jgi:predicted O-methyltransferase YrrM